MKKTLGLTALIAALTGFNMETHAQTVVLSNNFDSYSPGAFGSTYNDGSGGNVTATIVAPGDGGTGKALQLSGNVTNGVTENAGVNSPLYATSNNTDSDLSDYTLSFDLAITHGANSGVGVTLNIFGAGGANGSSYAVPISDNTVGGGFQHYSVNMGTLPAGYDIGPLVPTSSQYSFQLLFLGYNASVTATPETILLDNLQITVVPNTNLAQDCALPTNFEWTSTGPLATPQNGWIALKDFSCVNYNGEFIVYMSTVNSSGNYGGGMMTFTNWSQMATATQYALPLATVAPTLIYFAPKNIWVLMYEWGPWSFSYLTSTNPTNPNGWSRPYELYEGSSIDETVICDSTNACLFFADDNGSIYRATMPIGDFPGTFTNATTIMTDSEFNLFEAVQVYTVQAATPQYLMIVEAISTTGNRYFRSFTATNLMGSWTPLAAIQRDPFAGEANVTFTNGDAWTADFSSGDVVRNNPDQTQTINPCNMQFLYQGDVPTSGLSYNLIPWQPALLTLTNVVTNVALHPVISSVLVSGGGLVFAGNSGNSNAAYETFYLLASTNLATPLTNWNRVLTNQFNAAGGFNFTNAMNNNSPCCFYLLEIP